MIIIIICSTTITTRDKIKIDETETLRLSTVQSNIVLFKIIIFERKFPKE